MNPLSSLRNVGPAIIVAAVVLGPGSILTSSKVGASYGPMAAFVVVAAAILMIGMVILAARVGVIHKGSPCEELKQRLGTWASLLVGFVLFGLVALFQSSNNIAVIGGLEPILGAGEDSALAGLGMRIGILVVVNAFVIACVLISRSLYKLVENLMKGLILLMIVAFLINFGVALANPMESRGEPQPITPDLFALLGMIGTTFSIGGAFYQAYLVKERGWGTNDLRTGMNDSIIGISTLGGITVVILLTGAFVFHGRITTEELGAMKVGDVAAALEPLFGEGARVIFGIGILAGAFSSFLVNAMIGGTVMSDALGKGSRMSESGPRIFTVAALLVGMAVAIASLLSSGSTVGLITFAQALTVIGLPAMAAALIFLGIQKVDGQRVAPPWLLGLTGVGFVVSLLLAGRIGISVYGKLVGG